MTPKEKTDSMPTSKQDQSILCTLETVGTYCTLSTGADPGGGSGGSDEPPLAPKITIQCAYLTYSSTLGLAEPPPRLKY